MASYRTENGAELDFDAGDSKRYYAAQALLSQRLLNIDDRMAGRHAERDAEHELQLQAIRTDAVSEWSEAVRCGFVCC